MLIKGIYTSENGNTFDRLYSSENKYIRKALTDQIYAEVINLKVDESEYEEVDKYIEPLNYDEYGRN
jgi:hypothetical protein